MRQHRVKRPLGYTTGRSSNEARADRIAAGLCRDCTARQVRGSTYCEHHRQAVILRAEARKRRLLSEGRCMICGRPSVVARFCETHRLQHSG